MMKIPVLLAMSIFIVTLPSLSQTRVFTPEMRIDYAKKNALMGLRSGNNGVVESTMMFVGKMKMSYPSAEIDQLLRLIDGIAATHSSASMRFKAYIVSNICTDPMWYAGEEFLDASEPDLFYGAAAIRLQQKLFGLNAR